MAHERHKLQPDPAEGDRETVEHELKRKDEEAKKKAEGETSGENSNGTEP